MEKMKFNYKYLILTIIFILVILLFRGCGVQPVEVYAIEETTTTEEELLESFPDRVITYNCTLYTLSDGTQIPLPNIFTSRYEEFVIYKTTIGNTYYVVVPDFENYDYSIDNIIPTKKDGTVTFKNTREYILDLEDNYVNFPSFELYCTTSDEGANNVKFRFCNSDRSYYYTYNSDKLYSCSSLVVTDNNGFFYQSRFLGSETWKATLTLGKDFGIVSEMVSVASLVILALLLLLAFKKSWIFLKNNILT